MVYATALFHLILRVKLNRLNLNLAPPYSILLLMFYFKRLILRPSHRRHGALWIAAAVALILSLIISAVSLFFVFLLFTGLCELIEFRLLTIRCSIVDFHLRRFRYFLVFQIEIFREFWVRRPRLYLLYGHLDRLPIS